MPNERKIEKNETVLGEALLQPNNIIVSSVSDEESSVFPKRADYFLSAAERYLPFLTLTFLLSV